MTMQLNLRCLVYFLFFSATLWSQHLEQFEYLLPTDPKASPIGITKETSIISITGNADGNFVLTERDGCYFMPSGQREDIQVGLLPTNRRLDKFQQLLTKGDTTYLWANGYQLIELTGDTAKRMPIIGSHFAENMNPTCAAMDQEGRIFVGTAADGLFIFYPQKNGVYKPERVSTVNEKLPGNTVHCLYQDDRGVLWIGTDGGVATFYQDAVHNLGILPGVKSKSLWEYLFDGLLGENTRFDIPVMAITRWGDSMLFASPHTLTKVTGSSDTLTQVFHYSINDRLTAPLTEINGIHSDLNGDIWIFGNQLVRYNITSDKLTQMNQLYRFRGRSFVSLYEDLTRNCIWIGTYRGGLYRYDLPRRSPNGKT